MSEFDIFNLGVEDMNLQENETKRKILYSPNYKDGTDNVYKAIIRFIPNPVDPVNKSIDHKFVYWLDNPAVNVRGYYDSPTTIGEKCPMNATFWKLKNSDSAVDQKNAIKLKRKEQFHSLVYIVKDPQHPELEGKVMIFRYNKTIKALIDEQAKPDPDLGEEVEPVNIFDLFKGKNFLLNISRKGEFPDYTNCKFSTERSPIKIDDKPVEATAEGKKIIKEKILDQAPDLSEYGYQAPTEEDLSQIYTFLQTLTNDTSHLSSIMGNVTTEENNSAKKEASESKPKSEPKAEEKSDDSDEAFEDDFLGDDETKSETKSEAKDEKKEETVDAGSDDALEDFLNEI